MNQNALFTEDNTKTCEAVNCFALVTKKIKVKVGQKGSIHLFLCEKCESKFQEAEPNE